MLCTSHDVISLDNNPCDTGCLTSNPFFFCSYVQQQKN